MNLDELHQNIKAIVGNAQYEVHIKEERFLFHGVSLTIVVLDIKGRPDYSVKECVDIDEVNFARMPVLNYRLNKILKKLKQFTENRSINT